MSTSRSSSIPIVLGPSFKTKTNPLSSSSSNSSSRQSLVSIKYNFIPPSISKDSSAVLHCPKKTSPEWLLEYASNGDHSNDAQGFTGIQSAAKDVDCVLIWDNERKVYILDQLGSSFSLKFDRKHTQLTRDAKETFASFEPKENKKDKKTIALGLDIPSQELEPQSSIAQADEVEEGEDVDMVENSRKPKESVDEDDESDDFAKQLQMDLEAIEDGQSVEVTENEVQMKSNASSPRNTRTGLGLVGVPGHLIQQEESITPRGSPYLDRSTKIPLPNFTNIAASVPNSTQMRSTPGMSPLSVANSPRPVGLESSLSATWRPPAQRSAVAMAYDGDEDDEDDEDESDEDDDEEEEDDDLDAFARQLEGSLMEPATPIGEEEGKKPIETVSSSTTRSSRGGTRSKK